MKKNFKIFISIITILFFILIIFIIKDKNIMIAKLEYKIKELEPKFNEKDTSDLLNLAINIPEIVKSNLILINNPIEIIQYPFLNRKYNVKYQNKNVKFREVFPNPFQNQFKFDLFFLYPNDSAYLFFSFNENYFGLIKAKKSNNKWLITEKGIGHH